MRHVIRYAKWAILLLILLPIVIGGSIFYAQGWPKNWRSADWSATGMAEQSLATQDAVIQFYSARTGRWKGIFATHNWLVIKHHNTTKADRYDVVGWRDPVRKNAFPIAGLWYSNRPKLTYQLTGEKAAKLIGKLENAIANYPYKNRGDYKVWPGPNSNSFIAYLARQVPELGFEMPATAIGKDYLGPGLQWGNAASGTGWQISFFGVLGLTIAKSEGLEINILGAVIGLDPQDKAIKLPSFGRLGFGDFVTP